MKRRDLSGVSLIFNLSCRSVFLRSVFLFVRSFVRSFVHTCARVFVAAPCHQGRTEPVSGDRSGPVQSGGVRWSPVESGAFRGTSNRGGGRGVRRRRTPRTGSSTGRSRRRTPRNPRAPS